MSVYKLAIISIIVIRSRIWNIRFSIFGNIGKYQNQRSLSQVGGSETRFPWGMRIYIKDLLPNVFILRSRNDLYPTFSNRGYWIDPRDWIFRERNETILRISILEIDEASRANLFIKFSVLFFHPPRWN